MDEAKQTKPANADADTGAQTAARHDEATSGDTLSDLQQAQTDPAASQGRTSGSGDSTSDSSSAPSPDGMPDNTGGGTADGRDSGGPM
jgi:hypothetical protein